MKSYKKLEVSEQYYMQIMETQRHNKSVVREHIHGRRLRMYSDNMFIATYCQNAHLSKGELTDTQFFSFLGQFNKQLYKQFINNEELFGKEIKFRGSSKQKNHKAWDKLADGDYFYNIDMDSAYWQIAYKLGYINEKMYRRYLNNDKYKQAKRYVISFMGRNNVMRYHNDEGYYEIVCDETMFKNIYMNVRYGLYNIIGDCIRQTKDWLEYNIDGVMVLNTEVDKVSEFFKKHDLQFKISECRKLNEFEYSHKSKTRLFKYQKPE